ncbi:MAG: PKD domain-containing protein, partial [Methanomicrobiales archaeon]|nr:PKD domain-containing protein [Methanomicrobiales archaeon]
MAASSGNGGGESCRHRSRLSRLPPLIAILVLLLVTGAQGTECLITVNTSSTDQWHPGISGDRIVWEDTVDQAIHLYDFATGNESLVAPSAQMRYFPVISGSLVAWQEGVPSGPVILGNLLTGTTRELTTDGRFPSMDGQRVVWIDEAVPGTLVLYDDVDTSTRTIISNGDATIGHPSLSGNRVVFANATEYYIYLKDLGTGDEIPLASDGFSENRNPVISGDRVVWEDDRNGPFDLFLYDLASDTETPLTSAAMNQVNAAIDGTRVAWSGITSGTTSDLYLGLNMAGLASPRSVIGTGGVNDAPALSSDRVVWQKYAGSHYDIYLHTIDSPEPCPVAGFTANVTSGIAPLAVRFSDASGDPSITRWFWEFGDGSTSYEQNPVHIFLSDGSYSVAMTVGNGVGRAYAAQQGSIRVGPVPIVSFSANRTSGIAPLLVEFTDTSSGSPTGRAWDFGDGETSTE